MAERFPPRYLPGQFVDYFCESKWLPGVVESLMVRDKCWFYQVKLIDTSEDKETDCKNLRESLLFSRELSQQLETPMEEESSVPIAMVS